MTSHDEKKTKLIDTFALTLTNEEPSPKRLNSKLNNQNAMYLYSSKNLTEKNSSDYRISEESPMEGNDDSERGIDNYTPNY